MLKRWKDLEPVYISVKPVTAEAPQFIAPPTAVIEVALVMGR